VGSSSAPAEAEQWCPGLLDWLHREEGFGPEGYHVICLQPAAPSGRVPRGKIPAWVFRNASGLGAERAALPRPWRSFRAELQRRARLRPSGRWELHPWQLFDIQGKVVEDMRGALGASLLLAFEGGEFQYPAVHLGFRREVGLGRAVTLTTVALRPVAFLVQGALSRKEARTLQKLARPRLNQSQVLQLDPVAGAAQRDPRTSSSTFLPEEDVVVDVLNRSRHLLRVLGRQEGVQVVR
ncbi:unnamed protein product, partial [Effrenium voratum]